MEERPRGFIRAAVLYRRPYRDSFVFAYREVTWRSNRKYDGRVRRWDLRAVRTNALATDEPRKSPRRGASRRIASRRDATRRLDLGVERREGSLEPERGWRSTANRYTLATCMREQTVSPDRTEKKWPKFRGFCIFASPVRVRRDRDLIFSCVIYVCLAFCSISTECN